MIVGIKTERFIGVQWNPSGTGYQAFGIEERSELHATKGWRRLPSRRQYLGAASRSDIHRARTQGSTVTFKSARLPARLRGFGPMPISEKALMRHAWYRRQKEREARAAATEAWNNG